MAWSHIEGHDRIAQRFADVVARNRLAHAYLFVGPEGVGKKLFARELAKALLCERRAEGAPLAACDQCDACVQVVAGTHPDFFFVNRPEESNELPIDVMRALCRDFALKAARGRGKVAVVDDADHLNEESANCFLKTLEEPPPRSVFILIGSATERQLATIISRCQVVRFAPLPEPALRAVLGRNGITDVALLDRLVRLAAGSPGQALALADDALWQFRRTLLEGLAKPKPDAFALARGFVEFAEDAGKETALQRRRVVPALRLLIEALTDALSLHYGAPLRSAGPDDEPLLRALTERAGPEKLLAMLERCVEAEAHLNRYVQLSLVLEGLLDGLCA